MVAHHPISSLEEKHLVAHSNLTAHRRRKENQSEISSGLKVVGTNVEQVMKKASEEENLNFEVNSIQLKHTIIEFVDAKEANQEGVDLWHREHCPSSLACSISVELPNLLSPLEQ